MCYASAVAMPTPKMLVVPTTCTFCCTMKIDASLVSPWNMSQLVKSLNICVQKRLTKIDCHLVALKIRKTGLVEWHMHPSG
mmetsp:Transcript_61749/g.113180  ORF Transcript_61749/g.113180 Transcript_61749/m.113180 type:complete len:81 (+) Transcript_61749:145-387(+)